jgi:hypothetical protein
VDTEGSVLEAKVRSAEAPDRDGPKPPLGPARGGLSRPEHPRPEHPRPERPRLDAGCEGRGERWAEGGTGLSAEVAREPPKPVPEEVAKGWAEERAEGGARSPTGGGSCRPEGA